jgi:hypothetical protein
MMMSKVQKNIILNCGLTVKLNHVMQNLCGMISQGIVVVVVGGGAV